LEQSHPLNSLAGLAWQYARFLRNQGEGQNSAC
jgi:hypothetical protein